MGVEPGEPDLMLFLPGGRTRFIELKMPDGHLTDNQKIRHPILTSLGFQVDVLRTDNPHEALDFVLGMIANQ